LIVHRIVARNTATASPNKIHDETVARSYGFAGGLVPGVTVFAWMCGPALEILGATLLERGRIEARFVRPVYEADRVEVEGAPGDDGAVALTVRKGDEICATGAASLVDDGWEPDVPPRAPIPAALPAASVDSLTPGTVLGSLEVPFDLGRAREYLVSVGAEHALGTGGAAHPGWLILLANLALSSNVALGPWIHVSSDMRLLDLVADGERVSARTRVAAEYQRKGHRFVELDVVLLADEARPVAAVRHAAIYEPRRP
jgi:acyl dehydratase